MNDLIAVTNDAGEVLELTRAEWKRILFMERWKDKPNWKAIRAITEALDRAAREADEIERLRSKFYRRYWEEVVNPAPEVPCIWIPSGERQRTGRKLRLGNISCIPDQQPDLQQPEPFSNYCGNCGRPVEKSEPKPVTVFLVDGEILANKLSRDTQGTKAFRSVWELRSGERIDRLVVLFDPNVIVKRSVKVKAQMRDAIDYWRCSLKPGGEIEWMFGELSDD